jgi:hypothetical protein
VVMGNFSFTGMPSLTVRSAGHSWVRSSCYVVVGGMSPEVTGSQLSKCASVAFFAAVEDFLDYSSDRTRCRWSVVDGGVGGCLYYLVCTRWVVGAACKGENTMVEHGEGKVAYQRKRLCLCV